MKIMFSIAGLPPGGAERQLIYLLKAMKNSGNDIALCIYTPIRKIFYKELYEIDIKIYSASVESREYLKGPFKIFKSLREAARSFKPDLIFSMLHVANCFVRTAKLLRLLKAPVITSIRNDYCKSFYCTQKIVEYFLKHISNHIVTNHKPSETYFKSKGYNNITYIPNGIVVKECCYKIKEDASEITILTIGRVDFRYKNQKELLESIALLKEDGIIIKWIVIGDGKDRDDLIKLAKERSLKSHITFIKKSNDLDVFYAKADVFVLPSVMEGCPNVLLEAINNMCPVICSAYVGSLGVINNKTGIISDGDSARDFYLAIKKFAGLKNNEIETMAINAKKMLRNNYSIDRMQQEYNKIFLDVID